jgi:hypothetical protein
MNDNVNAKDAASASLVVSRGISDGLITFGLYSATLTRVLPEYLDKAMKLIERLREKYDEGIERELASIPRFVVAIDRFHNLVTTVGKNDILDKYLSGSSYTQTCRIGLKGTGSAAAGDTQASHSGWNEVGGANAPAYSGGRKTPSFSAASGGTKQTSAAVTFTFTSGGTVAGAFLNNGGSATVDDTTGVLVSAGDFTGGNKTVAATDQLNVTYSLSLT